VTLSADYLFVRGVKLSRPRNVNLFPPTILTPSNAASLGVPNPRPQQLGRNSLQTGNLELMDFRVLKYFPYEQYAHLDVVAEAFNLFNHPSVTQLHPFFGSGSTPHPGFGQSIGGLTARRVEFSLDFEF
jgi:hypothetical protein